MQNIVQGHGSDELHCLPRQERRTPINPVPAQAEIATCTPCYIEHLGRLTPTKMDQAALAQTALSRLERVNSSDPMHRETE